MTELTGAMLSKLAHENKELRHKLNGYFDENRKLRERIPDLETGINEYHAKWTVQEHEIHRLREALEKMRQKVHNGLRGEDLVDFVFAEASLALAGEDGDG
jgi:predicted nuclease with TOPRIM domain